MDSTGRTKLADKENQSRSDDSVTAKANASEKEKGSRFVSDTGGKHDVSDDTDCEMMEKERQPDDKSSKSDFVSAYEDDTEEEDMGGETERDRNSIAGQSERKKDDKGNKEADEDTEVAVVPNDEEDSDATDVEYYEKSYKDTVQKDQGNTLNRTMLSGNKTYQEINEACTCPVCYDDFNFVQDLRRHLMADDCQPDDGDIVNCQFCDLSFTDVEKFKDHHLAHMDKMAVSCLACGMPFMTKRALDTHMLVDAFVLNKLKSSKMSVTLPDLLCKAVVDVIVEGGDVSSGLKTLRQASHSSSYDDEDEAESEEIKGTRKTGTIVTGTGKEKEDMDDDEDDEDDVEDDDEDEESDGNGDENEEAMEEDFEDSSLPSEMEEDMEEAEDSEEEETGTFTQPLLSSSLSDTPITSYVEELDNDDSVTSQSHNSTEDATGATSVSSSRRKSKRPMQVPRTASEPSLQQVLNVDEVTIKVEPAEDGTVLTGAGALGDVTSLICSMCGDRLPDKRRLELHISDHEKLFPFFCSLCDANFMEGKLLKAHVAACHSASQSLQCQMCGMYFKMRGSLVTHMKFCRQAPACVVCGENFKSGPELEKHYYSHSIEERASAEFLSCSDCGEVFVSTLQLREHQKLHGAKRPFSCEVCGGTFTQQKTLDKHREMHYRTQVCKCEICGAQLLTRSGYIAHLRGHKNNESLQSMELDKKILSLLQEQAGRKKWKKGKKKEEDEENRNLVMDTTQYLKLIDDQFDTYETDPQNKVKKTPDSNKTRSHSCPFCDLIFTSIDRFQAHVRRLHKDQAQFDECEVCHRKVYGKEYMQKHLRTHTNFTEQFRCDQCSKVFRRKYALECHRKIHTFKKFVKCDICGEEFRFISEVDKHKHRAHKYDRTQASYECNICKMKFATLSHLSIHSSHSHKPSEGKPFKCLNCLTTFSTCVELKKHIYRNHQAGPCSGVQVKQEPMDAYEGSNVSGNDKDNPLYGQVKDYVRNFVSSLPPEMAEPVRDASGEVVPKTEPVEIDEEEDRIGVEVYNQLTRQKMSQSNMAKRFVCETCQKSFSTKSDLRTHIRTHTGETPYKCDYCDRAFKQRGHRKLHIQVTHTKDMPYTCELCSQSYPTRYRYQIHLKRHSGIKEHQCEYCDKAYYTVGKLNEHKRKHHLEFVRAQLVKENV